MEITLARLSTKNLATLAKRSLAISGKPEYAFVKGHPLLATLQTTNDGYDAVYAKSIYSGLGAEVETADHTLDSVFGGVKMTLLANVRDAGSPVHQESVELYAVIEKYGIGIDHYSYSEEVAQMEKLIEEFDLPVNVAKLEKVHLTDNVARLKSALTAFKEVFARQLAANAALRQLQSASVFRPQLESALRNYFTMVTSMRAIDGWKGLDAELNEAVKSARNSAQSTLAADKGKTTDTSKS